MACSRSSSRSFFLSKRCWSTEWQQIKALPGKEKDLQNGNSALRGPFFLSYNRDSILSQDLLIVRIQKYSIDLYRGHTPYRERIDLPYSESEHSTGFPYPERIPLVRRPLQFLIHLGVHPVDNPMLRKSPRELRIEPPLPFLFIIMILISFRKPLSFEIDDILD